MTSSLILVDEHDAPVGSATWEEAHGLPAGKLHRAFSIYVFRNGGTEILIQKRSAGKLFAGLWANTCCSHPREGENDIKAVAERRLKEELGFTCPLTTHSSFTYRAKDPQGKGAENEHVTIFRGDVPDDVNVRPNAQEIAEWKWIGVKELRQDMSKNPASYAPWFHIGLKKILSIHLAIIPDGNRRWAKSRMFKPWKGHETAIENFRSITEWCRNDPRVGILTVWCFSTENWKRDPEEIDHLMKIYEDYLQKERETFVENKTRFTHTGRLDRIPSSLATLIKEVEEETKDQTGFTLNLAVDYGGKDELIRAIQKLDDPKIVTEDSFRKLLDRPELPDIDLVLRTSGEQRTSNFFLWESTYTEWVFLDKLFPDLTSDDVEKAVTDFGSRTRRFGS